MSAFDGLRNAEYLGATGSIVRCHKRRRFYLRVIGEAVALGAGMAAMTAAVVTLWGMLT